MTEMLERMTFVTIDRDERKYSGKDHKTPDEINKEVFAQWEPYRQHVSKRTTFNDNDPIKEGVYSEVTRQTEAYAAKAVLVVAPR